MPSCAEAVPEYARVVQCAVGLASPLVVALEVLSSATNLANLHVRFRWSGFVEAAYRDAGVVFVEFTPGRKNEARGLYLECAKMIIQEGNRAGRIDGVAD